MASSSEAAATAPQRLHHTLLAQLEQARSEAALDEVLEQLKDATERWPDDEALHVALAMAYHRLDNGMWALRVLGDYRLRRPPACAAQTLEAWLRYRQAELDEATDLLEGHACAGTVPELEARRHLLLAKISEARGDAAGVRRELHAARERTAFYDEDEVLLNQLQSRYDPGWLPPLSWRLSLAAGWTSNGLSGTPVEAEATGTAHSGIGELRLDADWTHDGGGVVRPTVGLGLHAHELSAESARELSYEKLTLRPGLFLGRFAPRLRLGYRGEGLLLRGSDRYEDGPLWYTESHGGELELTLGPSYMAYASAGHRTFRERVRTRTEVEEGLIWTRAIGNDVQGALGASGRTYFARHRAYDQVGATLIASLYVELAPACQLRVQSSLSGEVFPSSEGYFPSAEGRERQELSTHVSTGVWWRVGKGLFAALEAGHNHRNSTADAYDFREWRGLGRVTWTADWLTLTRRNVRSGEHATLGWSERSSADTSAGPDVRELLRQDESVQRGSSCLN